MQVEAALCAHLTRHTTSNSSGRSRSFCTTSLPARGRQAGGRDDGGGGGGSSGGVFTAALLDLMPAITPFHPHDCMQAGACSSDTCVHQLAPVLPPAPVTSTRFMMIQRTSFVTFQEVCAARNRAGNWRRRRCRRPPGLACCTGSAVALRHCSRPQEVIINAMGAAGSRQAYDSPSAVAAKLAQPAPCLLAFMSPHCSLCASLRPKLEEVRGGQEPAPAVAAAACRCGRALTKPAHPRHVHGTQVASSSGSTDRSSSSSGGLQVAYIDAGQDKTWAPEVRTCGGRNAGAPGPKSPPLAACKPSTASSPFLRRCWRTTWRRCPALCWWEKMVRPGRGVDGACLLGVAAASLHKRARVNVADAPAHRRAARRPSHVQDTAAPQPAADGGGAAGDGAACRQLGAAAASRLNPLCCCLTPLVLPSLRRF